jgi:hypothetical protein
VTLVGASVSTGRVHERIHAVQADPEPAGRQQIGELGQLRAVRVDLAARKRDAAAEALVAVVLAVEDRADRAANAC